MADITAIELYERTCLNKTTIQSQLRLPRGAKQYAYRCPYCKKYHLTSSKYAGANRLDGFVHSNKSYNKIMKQYRLLTEYGASVKIIQKSNMYEIWIR